MNEPCAAVEIPMTNGKVSLVDGGYAHLVQKKKLAMLIKSHCMASKKLKNRRQRARVPKNFKHFLFD